MKCYFLDSSSFPNSIFQTFKFDDLLCVARYVVLFLKIWLFGARLGCPNITALLGVATPSWKILFYNWLHVKFHILKQHLFVISCYIGIKRIRNGVWKAEVCSKTLREASRLDIVVRRWRSAACVLTFREGFLLTIMVQLLVPVFDRYQPPPAFLRHARQLGH